MREIVEFACAKINLTLRVLGRRADGFHEIESLVAFAHVGDALTLSLRAPEAPSRPAALSSTGHFATEIVGENLVERAVRLVESAAGRPLAADLLLKKSLPVAAGIGGGSADAAAALRVLRKAFPELDANVDWLGVARKLGADVPVCLAGRACLMTGIGDQLQPLDLPALDIVLANPMAPVPADKTRQVFHALAAPPAGGVRVEAPQLRDRPALIAAMRAIGNDLEAPASRIVPLIADVKAAMAAQAHCEIALMSGAGPTVLGVFPTAMDARLAAAHIGRMRPEWWVVPTSTAA